MPFDKLNDLLVLISEGIRISDLSDDDEKTLKNFEEHLKNLISVTNTVLDGEKQKGKDEPINTIDAGELSKIYSEFVEESKDVLEGLKKANIGTPELDELIAPLANLTVPISHFAEVLKNPGEKSASEIFDDISWIPKLLGQDPDSLKKGTNEKSTREAEQIGKIENIEESINEYKEITDEAEQKYNTHYSRLLRTDNIRDGLQYQCELIASAIEKKYGKSKTVEEIKYYSKNFNKVETTFVKEKQKGNLTIIPLNSGRFERELALLFDEPTFEGNANSSGINENDRKALIGYFKKLNPRSYLLGISDEKLDKLNKTSILLSQIESRNEWFKITDNGNTVNALSLLELKEVSDAYKDLEKKLFNYIVKGEGETPKGEEIGSILDSICGYMKSNPDIAEPKNKEIFDACYNIATQFYQYFPGLDEAFAQVKEAYGKSIKQEFDRYKEIILRGNPDKNNFSEIMKEVAKLTDTEVDLPQDEYEKIYRIALIRDQEFREQQLSYAKDQLEYMSENDSCLHRDTYFSPVNRKTWTDLSKKELLKKIGQTVAICEFAGKQEEKISDNITARTQNKMKESTLIGYNKEIYDCFVSDELSEKQSQGLDKMVDDIVSNSNLEKIFEQDENKVIELLINPERKSIDSILHAEKKFDMFSGMTDRHVESLMEEISMHTNSDSYNAIRKSIADAKKAEEKIGGATTEDYLHVFDTAKYYLTNHDSKPVRSWGKERFDNAAKLMVNVGIKLATENPEMRKDIEKVFKLTMIRSENFREFLKAKLESDVAIEASFKNELNESLDLTTNALKEDYGKTMITGKLSDKGQATKIAEVFNNIFNRERILNHGHQNVSEQEVDKSNEISIS